jgi:hypothetical protein
LDVGELKNAADVDDKMPMKKGPTFPGWAF